MLDLCHCTQLVSRTPGVIPGLGQPLPFCPHPLDLECVWTLTWRRPRLDSYLCTDAKSASEKNQTGAKGTERPKEAQKVMVVG